ncbi:MAG: phosphatidate cytidylyltransferase [Myxococcales bacterium]|nr:phosphatidate cytidylyltransferase [Myxococcales bacterium]
MSEASEPEKEKPKGGEKKWLSNTIVRLLTAAVGIPIILWMLFFADPVVFSTFGIFAAGVAATELAGMTLGGDRVLTTWLVIATATVTAVLTFWPTGEALTALLFGLFVSGPLAVLVRPDPLDKAALRMGWLIGGPIYVGGAIAAIARLQHLNDSGGVWVVLAMALAWGSDTGGYFAGRAFGKHKLYEKVSPKKTVEGAIGGLAAIVAMALVVHFLWLPVLTPMHAVVLALVAGAIGQAGDLCVSVIKRSTGVKDSGKIIPGHGGLLDRIDALMFTATITLAYTTWVLDLDATTPQFPGF